jgi:benzoyl-CoA reductase/2-hydroxyglutaryl-CoA dehydratase subunit BcrC/BadD/HgdB
MQLIAYHNLDYQYLFLLSNNSIRKHPRSRARWPREEFFQKEIENLKKGLEQFVGRSASEKDLIDAIRLHNRSRALIRELYNLRKPEPPLISGTEVMWVLVAGMTIPIQEFNDLLERLVEEATAARKLFCFCSSTLI